MSRLSARCTVLALSASVLVALTGCTDTSPPATIPVQTQPNPGEDAIALPAESVSAAVTKAVDALPGLIDAALEQSGVPGLAVAVVHDGEIVYKR